MDTVVALEPKSILVGTTKRIGVDCSQILKTGQLLAASPTPTITSMPTGLTISNIAVNTTAFEDDNGEPVAAYNGVQFDVVAANAGKFQVKVIFTIDGTSNTDGGLLTLIAENFRP